MGVQAVGTCNYDSFTEHLLCARVSWMLLLLLSRVQLSATPWTAAHQAPLSIFQARVLEWVAIAFSISWINSFNSSCPLQYCCLENPMDRRDWWAPIHRAAKSWTQLVTEPTALQCL